MHRHRGYGTAAATQQLSEIGASSPVIPLPVASIAAALCPAEMDRQAAGADCRVDEHAGLMEKEHHAAAWPRGEAVRAPR